MLTTQTLVLAVSFLLVAWYAVGSLANRRRAEQLLKEIRAGIRALGTRPTVKWYGRTAFQVELGEPQAPLAGLHLLCLLEPRDFPVAQVWNRLRGRRDQVLIRVDYRHPPRSEVHSDPASYGIAGLTGIAVQRDEPHLQLILQVAPGQEGAIKESLLLAQELGR